MLFLALLLAGTGGACVFRPARAVRDVPAGEWHATLGGPGRAPFADESVPVAPVIAWQVRHERGAVSAPLVQDELLILGSTGRNVTVASARTGARYWVRRFDGPVVGSPLRTDSLIVLATASRRARVLGLTVARGRRRWERRLDSPVTSEPVLAGGAVLVATVRRDLYAIDAHSGDVRWRTRLPGQSFAAPVTDGAAVLIATERDTLLRVRVADGVVEARAPLPGSPSAALARSDSTLFVPLHPDRVAAFHARTLAPLWTVALDAPVLAAPAVDTDGSVYVLTRAADVWRITAGGAATRLARLGGTARESLTLTRNALLVGRLDGTLVMLDKAGRELWREQFRSALRSPVAVHRGQLFVSLHDGTVVNLQ